MTDIDKLYYKTCREQARLTQEQAAALLGIEPTTLSKYENGHFPVHQGMVDAMAKVYRTPSLARWHIEYANPALVPYLRMGDNSLTDGDAILQLELANDSISEERAVLKEIFRNGCVSPDEAARLNTGVNALQDAVSLILSAVAYLKKRETGAEPMDAGKPRAASVK